MLAVLRIPCRLSFSVLRVLQKLRWKEWIITKDNICIVGCSIVELSVAFPCDVVLVAAGLDIKISPDRSELL